MNKRTFLTSILGATLGASVLAEPRKPSQESHGHPPPPASLEDGDYRTIDGTGNNRSNPDWGSANVPFRRLVTTDYADGSGAPAGGNRASARAISNLVVAQSEARPNRRGLTDFFWQWGQFLDHDLDLAPVQAPAETFDIPVPVGDPWFDPDGTGEVVIPFERSFAVEVSGVLQQLNEITAFIDASNVFGSDHERALELRTLDGTGKLKTSAGDLLPFNENGFPNAPDASPGFFLAGDFRANEQVALTAMHTLFVREHNYWAERFADEFGAAERGFPPQGRGHALQRRRPRGGGSQESVSGERIYQWARAMVAAEMQVITYREFLPLLLGRHALPPWRGYRPDKDPTITNVFSTAAYRFGHSMLSPQILRLDHRGQSIPEGPLSLAEAFFSPQRLIEEGGIDPLLRGLAQQRAQDVDVFVIDEVRNFLFGPPGAGGFDLPALNIQRGRDHGLPSYNQVRCDLGLRPRGGFRDVTRNREVRRALREAYGNVDDVDLWVGGLAEDPLPGALVGETFHRILTEQFRALRDGDRFWYEDYLPRHLVREVESQTLADIIRRNTDIVSGLPRNVFRPHY